MVSAAYLSYALGKISAEELLEAKNLLAQFNLPISVSKLEANDVYTQMLTDKKVKNGKLSLVLLNSVGKYFFSQEVEAAKVLAAIKYVLN